MTPPPPPASSKPHPSNLYFTCFMSRSPQSNLYDTQRKFIYFFRLIIHADYWVVCFFFYIFFNFILTYAYPEIWWWMFPKAVNMEGVGGPRGAAPRKQQQFCSWQSTWRSYTVNVGFKFTLLIMNEYIDLFYPCQALMACKGGNQGKRTEAGYCNKLQIP